MATSAAFVVGIAGTIAGAASRLGTSWPMGAGTVAGKGGTSGSAVSGSGAASLRGAGSGVKATGDAAPPYSVTPSRPTVNRRVGHAAPTAAKLLENALLNATVAGGPPSPKRCCSSGQAASTGRSALAPGTVAANQA